MKSGSLAIWASHLGGGYCTFDFTVATSWVRETISFFGDTTAFRKFGGALMSFPLDTQQEVSLQQGSDDPAWPHYLLLKAYCYDSQGHSALRIVLDNRQPGPQHHRLEFSILAEVASLNDLGRRLAHWQVEEDTGTEWESQVS